MRIAVTGSIATNHLMAFPGRFGPQLPASFLVDDLRIRRGGAAANIAYGLGGLGLSPVLVGAVGADFAEYRIWLKEHGVDTDNVHVSAHRQTARVVCLTDVDLRQITAFYAGAMVEARGIDLGLFAPFNLALVAPDDPEAMRRHTAWCLESGTPFAADPSHLVASLDPADVRQLVDGARWLFTNGYEAALLLERTGWRAAELLSKVETWVTTLGGHGVRVERDGEDPVVVPAVPVEAADPTGAGDAFRAGFLAAVSWGLTAVTAAQLGCALASTALATVGPQDYEVDPVALLDEVELAYGAAAADPLAGRLGAIRC